eukprot:147740-Rhodomonas_salina.1
MLSQYTLYGGRCCVHLISRCVHVAGHVTSLRRMACRPLSMIEAVIPWRKHSKGKQKKKEMGKKKKKRKENKTKAPSVCLLYTSPSPRDRG